MSKKDLIKCPHCGYESEDCDFPNLYCKFEENEEYKKQYKLLKQLQDLGYNVVTCVMCGGAVLINKESNK